MTELHYEVLGAVKYPNIALKCVPKNRGVKFFMNTFGDALPFGKRAANNGHPIIAAQGTWAGKTHKYTEAHRTLAVKEAIRFDSEIAKHFPEQDFYYSPYCEHERDAAHMNSVLSEISEKAPNLIPYNSPNKGGVILKDWLNEPHGNYDPALVHKPGYKYMWACDGMSIYDCNLKHWLEVHAAAILKWAWIAAFNCKKKTTDDVPIPDRKTKPTGKQFKAIEYLEGDKGPAKLPPGFLWKSHADQGNIIATGRDCKPVLLVPKKLDAAEEAHLLNSSGKRVYTMPRMGEFHDGRPLFRCDMWGYELAKRYGRTLSIRVAGKVRGKVNPGWRENEWRVS